MANPKETDPARSAERAPAAPEPEGPVKIIKRYTNRKLYDTVESRYVTLEEIAEMIRGGDEVRIVDNRTKEDLTTVTLAQIIFEQEKKKSAMPLHVLKDIVRNGGDTLQQFINREIQPRVASIREEAESRLPRMFKKEREGEEGEAPVPRNEKEARATVRESLDALRASVEEWQAWVDGRVHSAVESVKLPGLQKEIGVLRGRLDDLRRKITQITHQASKPEGEAGSDDKE